MSISNYSELQTALTNWLARSNLNSRIPEFIALGEAYLNRVISSPEMIEQATVTTSSADRYASLPAGFLENISLVNHYGDKLIYASSGNVSAIYQTSGAGMPEYFSVTDQFEFDRVSDQAYSLTFTYKKKLDIASDSTNWLLTKHPDAYLYASLLQAMPFIRNESRLSTIKPMLDEIIYSINRPRQRALLRVDDALVSNGVFDIARGY